MRNRKIRLLRRRERINRRVFDCLRGLRGPAGLDGVVGTQRLVVVAGHLLGDGSPTHLLEVARVAGQRDRHGRRHDQPSSPIKATLPDSLSVIVGVHLLFHVHAGDLMV